MDGIRDSQPFNKPSGLRKCNTRGLATSPTSSRAMRRAATATNVPASTDVPSSQVVDTPTNAPLDASAAASAPNNLASGRVKDDDIGEDFIHSYYSTIA